MTSTTPKTCLSLSSKKRPFRRYPDERRSARDDIDELHPAAWGRDHPGTPRRNPGLPDAARKALMKPSSKALDGVVSAYLCNFLDENGLKPLKVLKKAGLEHADNRVADRFQESAYWAIR